MNTHHLDFLSPANEETSKRDFTDVLNDLDSKDMQIIEDYLIELNSHSLEYLIKQTAKQVQNNLENGNYSVELTSEIFCKITMQRNVFQVVYMSDLTFANMKINSNENVMNVFNEKIRVLRKEQIQNQIDELTKKL